MPGLGKSHLPYTSLIQLIVTQPPVSSHFLTCVQAREFLDVVVGKSIIVPGDAEVIADGEQHSGGVDVDSVHRDVDGERQGEITSCKGEVEE